jgi:hypothetical protein
MFWVFDRNRLGSWDQLTTYIKCKTEKLSLQLWNTNTKNYKTFVGTESLLLYEYIAKTVNADSLAETKRNIEPINIKSGNLLRLASRAKKKRGMGERIIVTRNVHDVDGRPWSYIRIQRVFFIMWFCGFDVLNIPTNTFF